MQRRYPRAYAYLNRFREQLARRRDRGTRQIIQAGGAFYSVFGVGPYTMSPWKVVWRYIATTMIAAVVGPDGDSDRPVIPDHRLMLVPCDNETEAHYLAAVLNSSISRLIVQSHVIGTQISTHVLQKIAIPRFDSSTALHRRLASLAHDAVAATSRAEETEVIESQVDAAVGSLFHLTADEVQAITASLAELAMDDAEREEGEGDEEAEDGAITNEVEPVLAALNGNGQMTAAEVAAAAGIDVADLRPLLRQLIEGGRIEQTGRGRGTRYRLVEGGER